MVEGGRPTASNRSGICPLHAASDRIVLLVSITVNQQRPPRSERSDPMPETKKSGTKRLLVGDLHPTTSDLNPQNLYV